MTEVNKNCLNTCSEDKILNGLCDCLNRLKSLNKIYKFIDLTIKPNDVHSWSKEKFKSIEEICKARYAKRTAEQIKHIEDLGEKYKQEDIIDEWIIKFKMKK